MNGFVPVDWKAQIKILVQAVKDDDTLTEAEKEQEIKRIKNSKEILKDSAKW